MQKGISICIKVAERAVFAKSSGCFVVYCVKLCVSFGYGLNFGINVYNLDHIHMFHILMLCRLLKV